MSSNAERMRRKRQRARDGIIGTPRVPITADIIKMLSHRQINWLAKDRTDDLDYIGQVIGGLLAATAANFKSEHRDDFDD